MRVHEVLGALGTLGGRSVSVEGFLVETGGCCYVAEDESSWQVTDRAILIDSPDVLHRLDAIVPGWVGGPSYQDYVTIAGVVRQCSEGPFRASLSDVHSLDLRREDAVFRVI